MSFCVDAYASTIGIPIYRVMYALLYITCTITFCVTRLQHDDDLRVSIFFYRAKVNATVFHHAKFVLLKISFA